MNDAPFMALMQMGIMTSLIFMFFVIGASIAIWLIMRPFWCWYFKINDVKDLLTDIRDLLIDEKLSKESDLKYSSLSADNPRNNYPPNIDSKIEKDIKIEEQVEAKIGPKTDTDLSMPVSTWNVDKPMQPPTDKKWQPQEKEKF